MQTKHRFLPQTSMDEIKGLKAIMLEAEVADLQAFICLEP
jgi:hypothetical protein